MPQHAQLNIALLAQSHRADLRLFRRALISALPGTTEMDANPRSSRAVLGPINSTIDPHIQLTFVGSVDDESRMVGDQALGGWVLTISVGAHHSTLHSVVNPDAAESAAWVQEIVGWAGALYTAGLISHIPGRTPTTHFFYVFFDATGRPKPVPANFPVTLTPVRREPGP